MKRLLILLCALFFSCVDDSNRAVLDMNNEIKAFSKQINKGGFIRYNLDASCSACIAKAIIFIQAYEKSNIHTPCCMYLEGMYKEIFSYYLDQYVGKTKIKIIFVEDDYPFESIIEGHIFEADEENVDI
ncbi:MAG: hypothetical protein E7111_05335 [Bacteroidales bacterium]|nr:hypothetical protein [Bacteroidales bacterium]